MTTPGRALNATVYRLGDKLPPEIREALRHQSYDDFAKEYARFNWQTNQLYVDPADPEPIVRRQEPFSDVVLKIATLVVIGAIVFTCLLIFVPTR